MSDQPTRQADGIDVLRQQFDALKADFAQHHRRVTINHEKEMLLMGGLHVERVRALPPTAPLKRAEFRVFSQSGDDGIIQFIINNIHIENDVFVEFGVQNYLESNTRFLLMHDNWRGAVIDGDVDLIRSIYTHHYAWRHDLRAGAAFITVENINDLIVQLGFTGDIGLLSVDIDGNDYWVWKAISVVQPRIVICEYNSILGCGVPVSIPYDPQFNRASAHYSHIYFGASLPALCTLAEEKGYDFIGCCSFGTNAYFVRSDIGHPFRPLTAREGFVQARFREERSPQGDIKMMKFLTKEEPYAAIKDMPLVDVVTGNRLTVGDLYV